VQPCPCSITSCSDLLLTSTDGISTVLRSGSLVWLSSPPPATFRSPSWSTALDTVASWEPSSRILLGFLSCELEPDSPPEIPVLIITLQLHLLWWPVDSHFTGHPCPPFLVQYHMGCDEEGSRAVQLLDGSSQDPEAFLALALDLSPLCDRRHCIRNRFHPCRVEN
jgi:hypothetical protein